MSALGVAGSTRIAVTCTLGTPSGKGVGDSAGTAVGGGRVGAGGCTGTVIGIGVIVGMTGMSVGGGCVGGTTTVGKSVGNKTVGTPGVDGTSVVGGSAKTVGAAVGGDPQAVNIETAQQINTARRIERAVMLDDESLLRDVVEPGLSPTLDV
jgi:hypothetical protein